MKRLACLLIAVVVMVILCDHAAHAQMSRKAIKRNNKRISSYKGRKSHFSEEKRYNAIGVSLNALNYYGDLSPSPKKISTDLSLTKPAIGISFTHRFGPRYQVTGSFTYGGIRGSDAESADPNDADNAVFRYARNLSFRNRIKELAVVAQVDLFENQATYISRVNWTPYAYLGFAVFHHNPQAQVPNTDLLGNPFSNAGEWVNLQPLKTEGKSYSKIQPAIPFGLGARFRLNEVMDFAVEFGFRYTFTDYLDDVSGNYLSVDDPSFGSNELARALSYRTNEVSNNGSDKLASILGNTTTAGPYTVVSGYGHVNADGTENLRGTSQKDIYMVTTFKLTYIIGKTFHRAKFR